VAKKGVTIMMMNIFNSVFPLAMILSPAVFSLFVRVQPEDGTAFAQQSTLVNTFRRKLLRWTAAAVITFAVLHQAAGVDVARHLWVLFFPLWFFGALPLLRTKDRGWRESLQMNTEHRAASLTRRDVAPIAFRCALAGAWAVWIALFAALVMLLGSGATPKWQLLIFAGAGAVFLAMGHYAAKASLLEPEPLDTDGSAELREAYAGLRRVKLWGWYGISVLAMLVFLAPPLLIAWDEARYLTPAVWIGAGGGGLVGVLGGVFGTIADLKRVAINRRFGR
jgi:hypothetical protein